MTSTAEGIEQDGELLADCANTEPLPVQIVQEVEGHFFYCIRANTQLEAWEIAQRLKGHIPTQSELDEMAGELNGGAGGSATIDVPGTGASIAVGDDFGGFQGLVLGKRALGIDNTLSDFQGDVEIKFFWASTSDGADRYLGALEDLDKRYGGQVAVLGINVRDDDEAALGLMHSVGVSFVNIADPSGDIADRFGVARMPLGVVVDGRSNRVEAVIEGSDPGDLEAFVDQWLGTNSSTL